MRKKSHIIIVPGRAYGPRSHHAPIYKESIKYRASQHIKEPFDGNIDIRLEYLYRNSGNKLDGDNLLKIVCDALKGIAYIDDSQVQHHEVSAYNMNSSYTIRGVPLTEEVIDCFSQEAFIIIRLKVIK